MTGLSIVLTGAWQVEGIEGVQVTTYAFQHGLPFPAKFTAFVLMLCLVFFAFNSSKSTFKCQHDIFKIKNIILKLLYFLILHTQHLIS